MERNIIEYFPHVLRGYREFKGIADGQQWLFALLWASMERVFMNQFIETADEVGIGRWEKILKITPKGTDTLEERRFRVKSRVNQAQLPYTHRVFQIYLASVSDDYETSIDYDAYTLFIRITLDGYRQRDDLAAILRVMIPANIALIIQACIIQKIRQPQFTVGTAVRTIVKHKHKGV